MKAKLFAILLLSVTGSLLLAQSSEGTPTAAPQPSADIATPVHPATPDQVREYLSLVNYVGTSHKAMEQMLKATRATSAPYYSASFWDDMETALLNIDLVTPVIPAYQKYFSEEDMAATIAFYKSPAGKRLLQAQPFIASLSGDVLRKAGREAGEQVGLKHKDEIEMLMKKQDPATKANPGAPSTSK